MYAKNAGALGTVPAVAGKMDRTVSQHQEQRAGAILREEWILAPVPVEVLSWGPGIVLPHGNSVGMDLQRPLRIIKYRAAVPYSLLRIYLDGPFRPFQLVHGQASAAPGYHPRLPPRSPKVLPGG